MSSSAQLHSRRLQDVPTGCQVAIKTFRNTLDLDSNHRVQWQDCERCSPHIHPTPHPCLGAWHRRAGMVDFCIRCLQCALHHVCAGPCTLAYIVASLSAV